MGNTYTSYQTPIRTGPPRRTASPSRVRQYIVTNFDLVDLEDLLQTLSLKDAEELQDLLKTKLISNPYDAIEAPYKVVRVLLPDGNEYLLPSANVEIFLRKVESRRPFRDSEKVIPFKWAFETEQKIQELLQEEKELEERQRLFEEKERRVTGLEKAPLVNKTSFKGECFDFLIEFDDVPIKEFLERNIGNIVIVTVTPGKEEATAMCASKDYLKTYLTRYERMNYVKIPAIVSGGGDVFVSKENLVNAIRYKVKVICIIPTGKTIKQGSETEPLFVFKRCNFTVY